MTYEKQLAPFFYDSHTRVDAVLCSIQRLKDKISQLLYSSDFFYITTKLSSGSIRLYSETNDIFDNKHYGHLIENLIFIQNIIFNHNNVEIITKMDFPEWVPLAYKIKSFQQSVYQMPNIPNPDEGSHNKEKCEMLIEKTYELAETLCRIRENHKKFEWKSPYPIDILSSDKLACKSILDGIQIVMDARTYDQIWAEAKLAGYDIPERIRIILSSIFTVEGCADALICLVDVPNSNLGTYTETLLLPEERIMFIPVRRKRTF